MAEQSYARHGHHPVPTYLAATFTVIALVLLLTGDSGGSTAFRFGLVSLALAVAVLVSISRTYIVRLQDRIIMLEMKVRGAELLTPEQEARLASLGKRHLIALRFASDAELPDLLDRAVRENLTPDQIKAAIKSWRADLHRT